MSESKTYVADKKVKGLRTTEHTTPLGSEIVEVEFEDGSLLEMPKKRYEATRTFKQSDATKERELITAAAAHHVLAVLHEFGIRFGEVNNLFDVVVHSVQRAHDSATSKLWGVLNDGDQDLNKINRVINPSGATKSDIANNSNGSAPAGSGADQEN